MSRALETWVMYYVRRDGKIKGPMTREKLSALRQEKRLKMRDEVSESPDGPWRMVCDVHELVSMADDPPRDESNPAVEQPLSPPSGVPKPGKPDEHDREWHASLHTLIEGDHLFRKPFRPWMYFLGGVFLVALAIYAISILIHPH